MQQVMKSPVSTWQ